MCRVRRSTAYGMVRAVVHLARSLAQTAGRDPPCTSRKAGGVEFAVGCREAGPTLEAGWRLLTGVAAADGWLDVRIWRPSCNRCKLPDDSSARP